MKKVIILLKECMEIKMNLGELKSWMFCVFLRFTQSFIDLGAKWIFANLPFAFF